VAGLTVHTYRAAKAGLLVNSYLVESGAGVLVVDTNLLASDIEALRARLAALKKPLLGVLVTHAHPDHFNGVLALVRDREVPVYAAGSVARVIEDIADAKRAQWSPIYGDEWPAETYYPNTRLASGESVEVGGISISVTEVGPAESHADSYSSSMAPGHLLSRSSAMWLSMAPTHTPRMDTRGRGWPRSTCWQGTSPA
jgi:glyoxylase-like metal-dependent hydrolase (beta-lactamase superfamily II)